MFYYRFSVARSPLYRFFVIDTIAKLFGALIWYFYNLGIDVLYISPYNNAMNDLSTQNKIIAASISLFSEKGYDGVGMRDIAKETDIAVSVLYYYYKNKEILYTEVFYDFFEKILSRIRESVELYKEKPFTEMALYLLKLFADLPEQDKDRLKVCFSEIQRFGQPTILREKITKLYQQQEFLSFTLLEKRISDKKRSFAISRIIYTYLSSKISDIILKNQFSETTLRDDLQIFEQMIR